MHSPFIRSAVLVLLMAGLPCLTAPGPTRDLHGLVSEQSGEPLRGAVVEIKDTHTLNIRSFITGRNGRYHFSELNPDSDYVVRASYRGKWSPDHFLNKFNEKRHPVINIRIRLE